MESLGLDIASLSIPVDLLSGQPTWTQIELLCQKAKSEAFAHLNQPMTADDQTCLLNYIETIALELVDKPMRASFRDTTGTGKHRREFQSRFIALILANGGRVPIDVTGFRNGLNTPTKWARKLVDIVTTWNTLTELREGLRLLKRHNKVPPSLAVSGAGLATHIQFSPIGDPLIQPRTRPDLDPKAVEWEESWQGGKYFAETYDALEEESGASLLGVLVSARLLLDKAQIRGMKSSHVLDSVSSHKKVLVQDLRRAGRHITFRAGQRFLDDILQGWTKQFDDVFRAASAGFLCPELSPLPVFLPVKDGPAHKCLRMLAATGEFGLQLLYRQMRLQEGLETKEAKAASQALLRAASRELARYQVKLIWPEFPNHTNTWSDDDTCVGIEEKKSIMTVRPPSEVDMWVFDRRRRTILIGEVKVARFASSVRELSREYDNFGRRGTHRKQLSRKLKWAWSSRSQFRLPWGGTAKDWNVRGAIFTNGFPESVWALHHDLPGIAPVGSAKAERLLSGST